MGPNGGGSGARPDPLDAALGALTPAERRAVEGREAHDPGAALEYGAEYGAEQARWSRLLDLESRAFDAGLDEAAGARIAARVVDRVRWEESQAARARPALPRRWHVVWVRLLAASVAVHVLVLGVWSILAHREAAEAPIEEVSSPEARWSPTDESPDARPSLAAEDPAILAPPSPFIVDPADGLENRLPVERLFRAELAEIPVPDPAAYAAFPRRAARAMWVRGSDPMKRLIEARVGAEGSLDAVRRSLSALARFQRPDGSYASATGRTAAESTALVLLAFLGDGNSSRGGEQRATVEKGIAWLHASRRADATASVGPYEVAALAEDFMLVNGTLTPAESRARSTELARLLERAPRAVDAAQDPATASAWTLASAALERAGLGSYRPVADAPAGRPVAIAAVVDARTAVWTGTETLRRGDAASFRRWASTSSLALRARLGPDGLTSGLATGASLASGDADRIEETALVLLALEVPYRTY